MIRSGFFNSMNGDRKYDASKFAEYFASFIGNGVFPDSLQVISNNNMTVTVKSGKAWINGYILINDADYILNINAADGVLNRIDRIVLRYDVVDREIRLEVKQGTFASSPVAPALQRDADAYELCLADIIVSAGAVSITQDKIADTRTDSNLCGKVDTLISGDYLTLTNAVNNKLDKTGDSKDNKVTFTEAAADTDIASGDTHATLFGKILKSIKSLKVNIANIINGTTIVGNAAQADNATNATNAGTAASCSGNSATATKLATPRKINGVNFDGTANITIADDTKAPKSHASTGTTYGVGTTSSYGHVKTINSLTQSSHVNGTALSAYQGKVLKDLVDTLTDTNIVSSGSATFTDTLNSNTQIIKSVPIGIGKRHGRVLIKPVSGNYVYNSRALIFPTTNTGAMGIRFAGRDSVWGRKANLEPLATSEILGYYSSDLVLLDVYIDGSNLKFVFKNQYDDASSTPMTLNCIAYWEVWS